MMLEKLGSKRILLNDDQRRRLPVKGKALGRELLLENNYDLHSRYDLALASPIGNG